MFARLKFRGGYVAFGRLSGAHFGSQIVAGMGPKRTEPSQAKPSHAEPRQTAPSQAEPRRAKAEPSPAEPSRAGLIHPNTRSPALWRPCTGNHLLMPRDDLPFVSTKSNKTMQVTQIFVATNIFVATQCGAMEYICTDWFELQAKRTYDDEAKSKDGLRNSPYRLSHFVAPLYVAPSTAPGNANPRASLLVMAHGYRA